MKTINDWLREQIERNEAELRRVDEIINAMPQRETAPPSEDDGTVSD